MTSNPIIFKKNGFTRITDFLNQISDNKGNMYSYPVETIHDSIFQNIKTKKIFYETFRRFLEPNEKYTLFITYYGIDFLNDKDKYVGSISIQNINEFIENTKDKYYQIKNLIYFEEKKTIIKKENRVLLSTLPEELIINIFLSYTPNEILSIKDTYKILNENRNDVWCQLLKEHYNINIKDNCYQEYVNNTIFIKINMKKLYSDNFDYSYFYDLFDMENLRNYMFIVYRNKIWTFDNLELLINLLINNFKKRELKRTKNIWMNHDVFIFLIKSKDEMGRIYNISSNDYDIIMSKLIN
jgi:hypothetical protein